MGLKKFVIDEKGCIFCCYDDATHLLLKELGTVHISERVGNVYPKDENWYVSIGDYNMGPFSTKGEAVEAENTYIENNNFFIGSNT